ncbi:MAG TPA: pyridoxamine 5'-phosphate oxidase family protein [Sulfuricurvum sp.]|nr:pyridoxamine 5'-phosphate oxidase family protein [Sulfuricurvum sp.]
MATDLQRIEAFIKKHHLLSLSTMGETLWCCSLFYAYDTAEAAFIVASDRETQHMHNVSLNPFVAGTVAWETKTVGKIQGIQFSGEMEKIADHSDQASLYLERFPYARVMNPTLWKITIHRIKMTDNTLGFGKKITWSREI